MPEIVDAYTRDGQYFGVVRVEIGDKSGKFEIGVASDGYRALRRVLQERPFETTTAGSYRYFFVPFVRRLQEKGLIEFAVRIEQGREGRQFEFRGPEPLVANLMWFFKLKDFESAAHLRQVS